VISFVVAHIAHLSSLSHNWRNALYRRGHDRCHGTRSANAAGQQKTSALEIRTRISAIHMFAPWYNLKLD
jgi:hypothetical protein